MKKIISFSIFLIGFTAMAAQIVLMREFLIVFYGNEVSVGLILANWLIGGAIGCAILGRMSDRIGDRIAAFSVCQLILAMLLPVNIAAIRLVRNVMAVNPGEIIGFFPMLASSFIILLPCCVTLGFMFSLASNIYKSRSAPGAERIGKVYVIESIGAIAGGLVASFILIQSINSFQIMSLLGALNILAALLLLFKDTIKRNILFAITILAALLMLAAWAVNGWGRLDDYTLKKQWSGCGLVDSKNSIYGNIAVTKRDDQVSFFDNGLHLYTVPDELNAEESVHFALLEHPDPKCVLLIGGGVGGLVEEIIKHPVKRLDYIELDPLIIKMAEEHLPKARLMPLEKASVSIINTDGRYYIKNTNKKYDCIIIAIGAPYTAQLNRFYTAEFFKETARILNRRGILSIGVTSSESYISTELKDFLSSLYVTLKKAFAKVIIIPGETAYFLATDPGGRLTYNYKILMERAADRKLNLQYVREYYLFSKLSREKISYIEKTVMKDKFARVNHDLRPTSYYYDIIFWSSRFRSSLFSTVLKVVTEKLIWIVIAVLSVFIILFGLVNRLLREPMRRVALISVMAAGFSSLAVQMLILISFQIFYGYLFYKLGIILTLFMAGLALGGLSIIKVMNSLKKDKEVLIVTQCAFCAYPVALMAILWMLAGSEFIFLLLPMAAGFIGGFQFPLANKIYLGKREEVGEAAGLTYGVDLLGSCLGALLTGAILVPVLGIPKTCIVISLVNLAVVLGMIL